MRFPFRLRINLTLFFGGILAGWSAAPTAANENPAQICNQAAIHIAKEANVPLEVLRKITRTESDRGSRADLEPWPWTVNMQGTRVWFDTVQKAKAYVFRHFMTGARSFDIGCFQLNYKWHSQAFNSIDEMFDPVINSRYAARLLKQLYAQSGDWTAAVGAYHSKTHHFAKRNTNRYSHIKASILSNDTPEAFSPPEELTFLVGPHPASAAVERPISPASLFAPGFGD